MSAGCLDLVFQVRPRVGQSVGILINDAIRRVRGVSDLTFQVVSRYLGGSKRFRSVGHSGHCLGRSLSLIAIPRHPFVKAVRVRYVLMFSAV